MLEAPRYFTRESKRKRTGEDPVEDERFRKIIKAMLARVDFTDEQVQIFEKAFLVTEIAGIQIHQTYQQAIHDLKNGNKWKAAVLEEIISLIENGT